MASNYLPPYAQCTLSNALFWGNCYNHYNNLYNNPGWNCVTVFHLSALFLESFPVIGQTISVFEFFISLLYYYFYPPQIAQNPLMQPVPIPLPYRTWPMPLEAPPAPQDPVLQRIGGMISDRHLVCFPRKGTVNPTIIADELWSDRNFHYLDRNDLTQVRYVSHFFNNILALESNTEQVRVHRFNHVRRIDCFCCRVIDCSHPGQLLSFSRQELFTISPQFFQLIGSTEYEATIDRERRIRQVQRSLRESQITLSPEELQITKQELLLTPSKGTPRYFAIFIERRRVVFIMVTENSTLKTLFTQFVIRFALTRVQRYPIIKDEISILCKHDRLCLVKFSAIGNLLRYLKNTPFHKCVSNIDVDIISSILPTCRTDRIRGNN